ncbi:restriction endonuclease subunit S [Camelliibacillus cellulosilyticus]|uniref:Restriction endonuclease subunit S n=1 Tax=Camelliibacillus cellulosilyticus TaxID=2174486 RepID=A0ABV9GQ73_9BACL
MANKVLLKDIAKITTGSTAPKDKYFSNNGLPFIRAGHLETLINKNNISELPKIGDETGKQLKLKKVKKGTILFAKSGMSSTKNRVYICTEDAYIVSHLAAIYPNNSVLNNYYLKYFLAWFKPSKLIIDESYPSIRTSDIGNIQIQLPSLKNQIKIVKILDQARFLIKKRQAQIAALDQLTQSVFLEMFSSIKGEKISLSELCEINPPKREVAHLEKNTIVSFIPMANVSETGEINLTETRNMGEVYNGFTYFKDNDVLFAKITPCMENGKGAIAKNLTNEVGFGSTEFHVLRPNEGITSEWLYYLTTLRNFRLEAEKNMTGSAGQKRVPKQFFDKYKIVKPSLESQLKFKGIVSKIEKQKETLKNSLTILETNYQSLMQRAFKGELFTEETVSNH